MNPRTSFIDRPQLLSYHGHSEERRLEALLDILRDGRDVALVSDAGTPVVSDPGSDLVAAARASGIGVVPIPGPSAVYHRPTDDARDRRRPARRAGLHPRRRGDGGPRRLGADRARARPQPVRACRSQVNNGSPTSHLNALA